MATELLDALNETFLVTESGRRRKVRASRVIMKQAVNQAMKGDPRHLLALMKHFPGFAPAAAPEAPVSVLGSDDDLELLSMYFQSKKGKIDEPQ